MWLPERCLRETIEVFGQQRVKGAMTNFDHELAQAIHRELLELRARANAVTPVELSGMRSILDPFSTL